MTTGLELRSKITSGGKLELSLAEVAVPEPEAGQVLIRVEGSPLNPSDLGLLTGPADLSTLVAGGTAERPTLTANVPAERLPMVAATSGNPSFSFGRAMRRSLHHPPRKSALFCYLV